MAAAGADGQEALVPDDGRPSQARWGLWGAGAIALPFLLYVVLRPENYSLTPNSLDPIFYTGYSINFDDVLNAVGARHYFITRWAAYYPMYVLDAVFGPLWGRLLWRWVLAAVIASSVWVLGRRLRWTTAQQVLIAVVLLTMPIFVRAFMTDYVEYLVVALGLCLVVLCLREEHTWWTAATLGAVVALLLVANPVAIFPSALACVTGLVLCRGGWRGRVQLVVVSSIVGALVVAAGLVLFRWQYGIDNVYQPSIDFMRTYQGDPDAWKSPRLEWLGRFVWIYAPPIVLIAGAAVARARGLSWTRAERAALVMGVVMYVFQWYDQFAREGFSLELSFYWSFGYPSFAIAFGVVLGKLTTGVRDRVVWMLSAGWVALLFLGVHRSLRLPHGLWFGLVAVIIVVACRVAAPRITWLPPALLLAIVAWTQLGPPPYDPSAYFFLNVSPAYDNVFREAGSTSELVLDQAIWFEETMDEVVNDASTSFIPAGGWSNSITALYAPHVTGRVVQTIEGSGRLTDQTLREIRAGARPIVAVFGVPEYVALTVDAIDDQLDVGQRILDETDPSNLGYRLVVYTMPDAAKLPFTWNADALLLASGELNGTSVVVSAPTVPNFVTFGPYVDLPPGAYTVTLTYASSGAASEVVGGFDVAWLGGDRLAVRELRGTDGEVVTAQIEFDVPGSGRQWEFRTAWSGIGDLRIDSVELERRG